MTRLTFPAKSANVLEVRMRQPNEVRKGAGSTRIAIDMRDASILQITDPKRLQGGNLVLNWFFPYIQEKHLELRAEFLSVLPG
jgi:hypothetical protein